MVCEEIRTKNNIFQHFYVLKTNQNKRHRYGEFLVEGVRNLNEAVSGGWKIKALLIREGKLSDWARGLLHATAVKNYRYDVRGNATEEGKRMIYGTLQAAMEYADRGCIEEWLQLFLRGDGHNVALADGLLLEPRQYWGPVEIELKLLDEIQSGAPEYLTRDNDIAYFFEVVDRMKDAYGEWNPPPLILEYSEDGIRVNDGRHRLEMYRQLGISKAWAVCWMTCEKA